MEHTPSVEFHHPKGFLSLAKNVGIKDATLDLTVIYSTVRARAAAMFTGNRFPGAPVIIGRKHVANGYVQALVINSKNANVAMGKQGLDNALETCRIVAEELGINHRDVLPFSTGVIGRPLPMEKIRAGLKGIRNELKPNNLKLAAEAIMTTDKYPKYFSCQVGPAIIAGIAKGAGMIEPNMATMLVYFFTNADVDGRGLQAILAGAVDRTFNSLTVDSDTSTSDTVAIFSTRAVPLDPPLRSDFVDAVRAMSIKLARDIVAQSEGATKLIECTVRLDSSTRDAKIMAKKIVNSPLVKTAVHGGDPNWGRIVMAIGKPDERLSIGAIARESVVIEMMNKVVFSRAQPIAIDLSALSCELKSSSRVSIDVCIGEGRHSATVWGCDLSRRYVDINAEYMT
jgi:glutamate N-acetyltransferase/amino-acid N-acetyltransferase